MKFFKNPVVAVLLALLIVLASTLVNVHVKYGKLCRSVTDEFYAEAGIADQLSSIRMDAAVLAKVAERNGIDAKELTNAANHLQDLLSQTGVSAGRVFRCYDELRVELVSAEQKLLGVALSDTDAITVSDCISRIQNAASAISASPYNETVRSFLAKYDRFPTHMLARLANVSIPEVFA